ncbi:hypothetical protein ACFRH6_11430 [Streptomyces sp. NPDC056749]|uniref:scabin-related ADP-ribosyltransferase n=1 Tax=Streptomyces sp. NPDC056749 TaxID=3345936 RepID=UPI0036AF1C5C
MSMHIIEAKWQIIAEVVRLAVELAVIAALSFFTGGASAGQVAAAQARSRLLIWTVLSRLLKRAHVLPSLSEAFDEAFQTFAVRLALMVGGPSGRRPGGFDAGQIFKDAVFGGFAGLFHGAFGGVLERFGKVFREGWGQAGGGFPGAVGVKDVSRDVASKASGRSPVASPGTGAGPKLVSGSARVPGVVGAVGAGAGVFVVAAGSETAAEVFVNGMFTGNWQASPGTFMGAGISGVVAGGMFTATALAGHKFGSQFDFGGVNTLPGAGTTGRTTASPSRGTVGPGATAGSATAGSAGVGSAAVSGTGQGQHAPETVGTVSADTDLAANGLPAATVTAESGPRTRTTTGPASADSWNDGESADVTPSATGAGPVKPASSAIPSHTPTTPDTGTRTDTTTGPDTAARNTDPAASSGQRSTQPTAAGNLAGTHHRPSEEWDPQHSPEHPADTHPADGDNAPESTADNVPGPADTTGAAVQASTSDLSQHPLTAHTTDPSAHSAPATAGPVTRQPEPLSMSPHWDTARESAQPVQRPARTSTAPTGETGSTASTHRDTSGAFEIRRFTHNGVPIADLTVEVAFSNPHTISDTERQIIWERTVEGVEHTFNTPGHLLPTGERLHITVTPARPHSQPHLTVELADVHTTASPSATSELPGSGQIQLLANSSPADYARHIGRHLGLQVNFNHDWTASPPHTTDTTSAQLPSALNGAAAGLPSENSRISSITNEPHHVPDVLKPHQINFLGTLIAGLHIDPPSSNSTAESKRIFAANPSVRMPGADHQILVNRLTAPSVTSTPTPGIENKSNIAPSGPIASTNSPQVEISHLTNFVNSSLNKLWPYGGADQATVRSLYSKLPDHAKKNTASAAQAIAERIVNRGNPVRMLGGSPPTDSPDPIRMDLARNIQTAWLKWRVATIFRDELSLRYTHRSSSSQYANADLAAYMQSVEQAEQSMASLAQAVERWALATGREPLPEMNPARLDVSSQEINNAAAGIARARQAWSVAVTSRDAMARSITSMPTTSSVSPAEQVRRAENMLSSEVTRWVRVTGGARFLEANPVHESPERAQADRHEAEKSLRDANRDAAAAQRKYMADASGINGVRYYQSIEKVREAEAAKARAEDRWTHIQKKAERDFLTQKIASDFGIQLNSSAGAEAVRHATLGSLPFTPNHAIKPREFSLKHLHQMHAAMNHYAQILGKGRANSSRSETGQEITQAGAADWRSTHHIFGEFSKDHKLINLYTSAIEVSGMDSIEPTVVHELAHGILGYALPTFTKDFWEKPEPPLPFNGAPSATPQLDFISSVISYLHNASEMQRRSPRRAAAVAALRERSPDTVTVIPGESPIQAATRIMKSLNGEIPFFTRSVGAWTHEGKLIALIPSPKEQPISEYARTNPDEDLAETAKFYFTNLGHLRQHAPLRAAAMDEIVREWNRPPGLHANSGERITRAPLGQLAQHRRERAQRGPFIGMAITQNKDNNALSRQILEAALNDTAGTSGIRERIIHALETHVPRPSQDEMGAAPLPIPPAHTQIEAGTSSKADTISTGTVIQLSTEPVPGFAEQGTAPAAIRSKGIQPLDSQGLADRVFSQITGQPPNPVKQSAPPQGVLSRGDLVHGGLVIGGLGGRLVPGAGLRYYAVWGRGDGVGVVGLGSHSAGEAAERAGRWPGVVSSGEYADLDGVRGRFVGALRPRPWGDDAFYWFGHGSRSRVRLAGVDGTDVEVTGPEFGRLLLGWSGLGRRSESPFVIYSCEVGRLPEHGGLSVAQQVANVTGRVVYAPTTDVGTARDSEGRVRPVLYVDESGALGAWSVFAPEPSGERLAELAGAAGLHDGRGPVDLRAGLRTRQLVRTLRGTLGGHIEALAHYPDLMRGLAAVDALRWNAVGGGVAERYTDGRMTPDLLRRVVRGTLGLGEGEEPSLSQYEAVLAEADEVYRTTPGFPLTGLVVPADRLSDPSGQLTGQTSSDTVAGPDNTVTETRQMAFMTDPEDSPAHLEPAYDDLREHGENDFSDTGEVESDVQDDRSAIWPELTEDEASRVISEFPERLTTARPQIVAGFGKSKFGPRPEKIPVSRSQTFRTLRYRQDREPLYRYDTRHHDTIFNEGFRPWNNKAVRSLAHYQAWLQRSAMVSTTRHHGTYAPKWAEASDGTANLYVINAPGGIDMVDSLRTRAYGGLQEVVFWKGIRPVYIDRVEVVQIIPGQGAPRIIKILTRNEWRKEIEEGGGRTLADGSWRGPGGLTLTVEANDLAEDFVAKIGLYERGITAQVESCIESLKHLNLSTGIRGENSLKRELATQLHKNPNLSAQGAINNFKNSIHYTITVTRNDKYVKRIKEISEELKGRNYELLEQGNSWSRSGPTRVKSIWRNADIKFEIQFHTKKSHAARDAAQMLYEKATNFGTGSKELSSAYEEGQKLLDRVPVPSGALEIRI